MRAIFGAGVALLVLAACGEKAPVGPGAEDIAKASAELTAFLDAEYEEQLQFSPEELTSQGRKDQYGLLDDRSEAAADKELAWYKASVEEMKTKFKPETLNAITMELEAHVARGHITPTDLVHFMAEVGHATYKDEPRFNPPDGSGDHPVLNPNAAMVKIGFDSTQYDSAFWAEYREFEKAHREEFSDSASGPVRGRRR